MANLSKKIWIDNFIVSDSKIDAYTLIDDADIDFSINKKDFEEFCDKHELREWENYHYNYEREDFDEWNGTHSWEEVYTNHETMVKFLTAYIGDLYMQDAMDIEAPIKSIVNQTKKAI